MKREDGFTLAELLIVIAILAVLIAVALPLFSQKLEDSKDTVTVANLRAAYALAAADIIDGKVELVNGKYTVKKTIEVLGTQDGGVAPEDGFEYPFKTGENFDKFGNKANGKTTVVFTWDVTKDSEESDITFTDGATASAE